MGRLTLATYNVNSIRSRLHILLPWLEAHRPDLICLQETKVEDAAFPRQPLEDIGYNLVFRGEKKYNGVAIAALDKLENVSFGLTDGGPPDEPRLIRGVYRGIHIVNTYVPQGREKESPQFAYKLQWLDRLAKLIARDYSPRDRLIWCGDINIAPEAIDVHDPKRLLGHVCFNPLVWQALSEIRAWGLNDVFRRHHPDKQGQFTFFDYRIPDSLERGLGWRIDHIHATAIMADGSRDCGIDLAPRRGEKPSDHTILWAEFEL